MTWETFEASLRLVKHYCNQGTQNELALTGIGESLLHPLFVDMVREARNTIGPTRPLTFSTNGLLFDDEIAAKIAPYKPEVYVSLHHLYKSGRAVDVAKRHGVLAGVNASAALAAFDWAGQIKEYNKIDWPVSAPAITCDYLRIGWGVILVDGSVTTCCIDASGAGVVGTVYDAPKSLNLKPFKLCGPCHMKIPTELVE